MSEQTYDIKLPHILIMTTHSLLDIITHFSVELLDLLLPSNWLHWPVMLGHQVILVHWFSSDGPWSTNGPGHDHSWDNLIIHYRIHEQGVGPYGIPSRTSLCLTLCVAVLFWVTATQWHGMHTHTRGISVTDRQTDGLTAGGGFDTNDRNHAFNQTLFINLTAVKLCQNITVLVQAFYG